MTFTGYPRFTLLITLLKIQETLFIITERMQCLQVKCLEKEIKSINVKCMFYDVKLVLKVVHRLLLRAVLFH